MTIKDVNDKVKANTAAIAKLQENFTTFSADLNSKFDLLLQKFDSIPEPASTSHTEPQGDNRFHHPHHQPINIIDFLNWIFRDLMYKNKKITLQGTTPTSSLSMMSSAEAKKFFDSTSYGLVGHLNSISTTTPNPTPSKILPLLQEFDDIFAEPTQLPPQRNLDHKIPLQPNSVHVNQRAYKCPYIHKDIVEHLFKEMLHFDIIQPIHSPFASPILLVKKKGNTWRFYVDYRNLNSITVKDKFPIPIIEELLDELNGATVFTRIDLRAGYHQIRVHLSDIFKTTFRTHQGHYEFKVMPFGLTNTPATFQALMNEVFQPALRKFILVFFDDILIYSKTMYEHVEHLKYTFSLLRQHKLYAKMTKCCFGQSSLEYLGHIITAAGVCADPSKIACMQSWPTPSTLKELRGFLGLTGYYKKFVKNYGEISKPLTDLLKKNSFLWTSAATTAFENLKTAMSNTPVLALPNFTKPFIVQSYASDACIGAVLIQEGRPIAYFSKPLGPRAAAMSTYEKKLLAIVLAYKKGAENTVVDALSRRPSAIASCHSITTSTPNWVHDVTNSYTNDPKANQLISQLLLSPDSAPHYTYTEGILRYKTKLYIGTRGNVIQSLLESLHVSALGGHSGVQGTIFIGRTHQICSFLALQHPYTAASVAHTFFNEEFKLHGLPSSIVSDRDKVFTSNFWQDLFKALGTTLNLSTAYHPQTDSQTERVNACLEIYLRCLTVHKPGKWGQWIALAEWWYNTSFHTSLKMSPFQALYGYVSPHLAFHASVTTSVDVVETYLKERNSLLDILKESLHTAQARMKFYADQSRKDRSFEVGDLVYLKLQPYRQASLSLRKNFKLSSKFYWPFPVLQKVGPVAYRLELPSYARIHPVFHVSQLKKHIGLKHTLVPTLPVVDHEGAIIMMPEKILQTRQVLQGGRLVKQVLLQWTNSSPENTTWEALSDVKAHYPKFILEDKDSFEGEAMS
ncbi:uncharacterized protein LOC113289790 [Papaver somniferum]|uniref:uncharacterized protein LOC113289790 n=1 Tax=Papaver somniferum TaxID=3469 RepID=UPI000E6FAB8C|nr:uncharacterized protein LOC113289790 [Papaver somniferum]